MAIRQDFSEGGLRRQIPVTKLASSKAPRLISMHPLARITLYVILYWYVNSTAIDVIWRIAQPTP